MGLHRILSAQVVRETLMELLRAAVQDIEYAGAEGVSAFARTRPIARAGSRSQGRQGRPREKRPYHDDGSRRRTLGPGEAYCCRCRAPTRYRYPRRAELKPAYASEPGKAPRRVAIRAHCRICNARVFRIVRAEEADGLQEAYVNNKRYWEAWGKALVERDRRRRAPIEFLQNLIRDRKKRPIPPSLVRLLRITLADLEDTLARAGVTPLFRTGATGRLRKPKTGRHSPTPQAGHFAPQGQALAGGTHPTNRLGGA